MAIEQVEEWLRQLMAALTTVAEDPTCREHVGWLRAFRGIDTMTAMTILTEVHDLRRFATARNLMAYLGLVPKERSSGQRVRRGRINKRYMAERSMASGPTDRPPRPAPAAGLVG